MSLCMLVLPLMLLACTDEGADDGHLADDDDDTAMIDAASGAPDAEIVDTPDAADEQGDADVADVDAQPADAGPAPVSFAADVMPILRMRCGGCHLKPTGGAGGLSLGMQAELAYAAMLNQDTASTDVDCADLPRVDGVTYDPMKSSLYLKLVGDTCGKRMPSGATATPLLDEQIELVRRWIVEGAQDN